MGKERLFSEWTLCAFLLVGLAAGIVAGMAIYELMHPALQSTEWLKVMTAFGTVGAVIVALYLAAIDSRRRKQEIETRASLYAASMGSKLRMLIKPIRDMIICIELEDENAANLRFFSLLETVERASHSQLVTQDDLVPLIGLGGNAAHRIAHGLAILSATAICMRNIHNDIEINGQIFTANSYTKEYISKINSALDLLEAGCNYCERAALIYATQPTGEELYGDI